MADYNNEDRARDYKEIEDHRDDLPVLTNEEAIIEQMSGRPAAHLISEEEREKALADLKEHEDGATDADIQQAAISSDHTENANVENKMDGTYAKAVEAVDEARDNADTDKEAADAIADALPEGVSEAELQDAVRRGMTEPGNARTEPQQKLLKQQIEQGEDGETTEEGLRLPDTVDAEAPKEEEGVAGAADEGHEVPGDEVPGDPSSKYSTVKDAEAALPTADRAEAEAALTDNRAGVQKAAQARLDALNAGA